MSFDGASVELGPVHASNDLRASSRGVDEELVARIALGDREAFAALYHRYEPTLIALARRLLGSPSDAEDLVHDVCLEVWRQAHTYTPIRGTVRTWLVTRLRSRALDRLRSTRHSRDMARDEGDAQNVVARDMDPALKSDCARVQRAVRQLPEEQRAVLELAYFEGLPLPEIGERLAIPVGTAKSRLSRALSRLRDGLFS